MTDIICISPKAFMQAKSTVQVESKIEELYANLISSHACFTSTMTHFEPHVRVPRQHKHIHAKHTHVSESRKPVVCNVDPLRKVKGLLNVINTTNFDKINRKLQFTINERNAHDICMLMINTACMQIFFVHVFMKLLHQSIQTTPKVQETCIQFVDDFFRNDSLFDIAACSDTHDFADYQRAKKVVVNTSVVVMEMIKNQYVKQYRVHQFVTHILNKLQHYKSETEFDLLLSVLVEVKKRSANLKLDKVTLHGINNCSKDSRIQFMLETLLK